MSRRNIATDIDFIESEHPRAKNGEFSNGSGRASPFRAKKVTKADQKEISALRESIKNSRDRLGKATDPFAKKIIERNLEEAKASLTDLSKKNGIEYSENSISPESDTLYHRYTRGPVDTGVGYMMFSENQEKVANGYGSNHYAVNINDIPQNEVVDANSENFKTGVKKVLQQHGQELPSLQKDEISSLVDLANPDDIVNSAGIWDAPDIVNLLKKYLIKPSGITAVKTKDGIILFNKSHAKKQRRQASDKAGSTRTVDQDGRLHVALSNISKATVNPYRGKEIPRSEELGLDPEAIYFLLRDPVELAKAAPTFNNLPLLSKHIPVTADEPQKDLIVGSTGTDAAFQTPYLSNSLVIWDAVAIAGIQSEEQKELSSSYHYDADMTPGTYQGVRYDGVMRNLRGNHVALVEEGRAGRDVVVGDSQLPEYQTMKRSRKAIAVIGALRGYLRPRLAADATIGDLSVLVRNVRAATYAKDKARVAKAVQARFKDKLAADADLSDVVELLDALDGTEDDLGADDDIDDDTADDAGDEKMAACLAKLKGMLSAEDYADIAAMMGTEPAAVDEDPKDGAGSKKPAEIPDANEVAKVKVASDAAIKKAADAAREEAVARMQAIRTAEREVQPLIGEVVAMDSAEDIYRTALEAAEVDLTDVPPAAYRALVRQQVTMAKEAPKPRIAQDAAAAKSYAERFKPGRLIRS